METLTFLFTDIEGSTVLLRRLGEGGYAQVLADHHSLIRSGLAANGGEERSDHEALSLLAPVLERPDARTEPELFGKALVTAATLAQFHDTAAARQLGGQAVEFARQQRDDQLLSDSLMELSSTYYFSGEAQRGFPLAEEAVQCARRLGDDFQLGGSLMVYLLFADRIGPARRGQLFAEAIACTERYRPGLSGPDRRELARARSALPPGQPHHGACHPRRGAVRPRLRTGQGAQPRPGPRPRPPNDRPRFRNGRR